MNKLRLSIKCVSDLSTKIGVSEGRLYSAAMNAEQSYHCWQEPKINGGVRSFSSPKKHLKEVQRKLHKIFTQVDFGNNSHYGIKRRSNITNSLEHRGNSVVFVCDIKSFFPSIRPERVFRALVDEQACSKKVAGLLTRLVTFNHQLPQGAPTSTDIANIVTLRLQRRLYGLAQAWGITKFTIHADDITFSGKNIPEGFESMVVNVIKEEGFKIHPNKNQLSDKSKRQIITGINIAHGLSVGKKKKQWRAEHHNNLVKLRNGELSKEQYELSEIKYNGRIVYADYIKKIAQISKASHLI
jgi:RNA-directed DNA polymerase